MADGGRYTHVEKGPRVHRIPQSELVDTCHERIIPFDAFPAFLTYNALCQTIRALHPQRQRTLLTFAAQPD